MLHGAATQSRPLKPTTLTRLVCQQARNLDPPCGLNTSTARSLYCPAPQRYPWKVRKLAAPVTQCCGSGDVQARQRPPRGRAKKSVDVRTEMAQTCRRGEAGGLVCRPIGVASAA